MWRAEAEGRSPRDSWTDFYTDENGRQRKRSTKLTDRHKALVMAQKFEVSYRIKATEAQARKVVSEIYEQIHGERADRDIAYVHRRDLTALRDKTAAALSVSTANTDYYLPHEHCLALPSAKG